MDEKTPWHFLSAALGTVLGLVGGFFAGGWAADLLPPGPLLLTSAIVVGTVCGGRLGLGIVDLLLYLGVVRENRRRGRERRSSPDTIRDSLGLDP